MLSILVILRALCGEVGKIADLLLDQCYATSRTHDGWTTHMSIPGAMRLSERLAGQA